MFYAGECEFCGMKMRPASGIPRNKRLQFHILRRCPKYASHAIQSNTSDVLSTSLTNLPTPAVCAALSFGPPVSTSSTSMSIRRPTQLTQSSHPAACSVSLAPPSQATPSTSTSQPTCPATSSADQGRPTMRPRPVLCKKKSGDLGFCQSRT